MRSGATGLVAEPAELPMRSIVSTSKGTPAARSTSVTCSAGAEGSAAGRRIVTRYGAGVLGAAAGRGAGLAAAAGGWAAGVVAAGLELAGFCAGLADGEVGAREVGADGDAAGGWGAEKLRAS